MSQALEVLDRSRCEGVAQMRVEENEQLLRLCSAQGERQTESLLSLLMVLDVVIVEVV